MASSKTSPAKSAKADAKSLATEKARATALAKQYGGKPELLSLADAQKAHPGLVLTAADLTNPAWFHLRFRPCGICGRFPARAIRHYEDHASGRLDANGHRTDAAGRKAIGLRVAKAAKTLAAERKPARKAKAKAA